MSFFLVKIFISALAIAGISEVAKHSDKFGGMIAALPITTFLILLWMWGEGASDEKIASHMRFTLFFVLPTLPMFLAFPWLLQKLGFGLAFGASLALTGGLIYIFNMIYQQFGMRLF